MPRDLRRSQRRHRRRRDDPHNLLWTLGIAGTQCGGGSAVGVSAVRLSGFGHARLDVDDLGAVTFCPLSRIFHTMDTLTPHRHLQIRHRLPPPGTKTRTRIALARAVGAAIAERMPSVSRCTRAGLRVRDRTADAGSRAARRAPHRRRHVRGDACDGAAEDRGGRYRARQHDAARVPGDGYRDRRRVRRHRQQHDAAPRAGSGSAC